ncbi:MAG: serine hydrolase [Muribaculaceae bacterium]|nr:serine hydrolase [Muribaculaceae bacterium]
MKYLRFLVLVLLSCAMTAVAQVGDLPRSTPAEQGVQPQAVLNFMRALNMVPETEIHHVMVARHGKVIAEMHMAPFAADDGHTLYSESKTFTSMAVGIAVGENRLRLTDRVASFFPDKLPDSISDNLSRMTVRDVLLMASGITPDWEMRNVQNDWLKTWLAKPVSVEPGKKFQYDSMCTFLLSAIVQRVTGKTLLEYLQEKMFGPMHITEVDWETSADGINTGGWGLRLQAESQLKLGLLMLARGQWNGQQLVPAQWIDEGIKPHIYYENYKPTDAPTDGNQGYGYQIWNCKWPGAFRADGAYGQFIVCVPQYDLVVVINEMTYKGHEVLACIWDQLMPGVKNEAVAADNKAQAQLDLMTRMASLQPSGESATGMVKLPMTMTLEKNRHGITSITLGDDKKVMITYENTPNETLLCGDRTMRRVRNNSPRWARTALRGVPPYSVSALNRQSGLKHNFEAAAMLGWNGDSQAVLDVYYVNWISATTFTFDFEKHTVTVCDNFDKNHPETVSYFTTIELDK